MKKTLFALALMPLFFVACSSSDDDSSPTSDFDYTIDLLYGEWRATRVEANIELDLTTPINELNAAPTYLKFNKDGTLEGEGLFGEGTGKYSTKGKAIYTSIGNTRKTFEVTSLNSTTGKFKLNAKDLGTSLISVDAGMVTVTLIKNYLRTPNFDYDIKKLYGKWRATSIEGISEKPIELDNPFMEKLVEPTYLTFEEKGIYSTIGFLGKGKGRYSTKEKTIYTLIDKDKKHIKLEMTSLGQETARVEIDLDDLSLDLDNINNVDKATIVLTKQNEK